MTTDRASTEFPAILQTDADRAEMTRRFNVAHAAQRGYRPDHAASLDRALRALILGCIVTLILTAAMLGGYAVAQMGAR